LATISDALAAYRICAQAEGKSPKTIRWIMSSVTYFGEYLGANQDVNTITANDLRGFIIALKQRPKLNISLDEIIDAVKRTGYAVRAAGELGCSDAYIHQRLKLAGMSLREVLESRDRRGSGEGTE